MTKNTLEKSCSSLIHGIDLQDCKLVDLEENKDRRGSFTEIFQQNWETLLVPVQWSMVRSEESVFRGMHYHLRHDEFFCLIQGSCYLGLKDLRFDSSTFMHSSLYYLKADDLKSLIFPRGIVHGWYFPEPSVHIQSVSEAYLDYGDEDNYGCHWQDPDLGIPWPFECPILAKRAQGFGTLKELPPFDKKSF